MNKVPIVTRFELLKQLRRKRFYGGVAITVGVILLAFSIWRFTGDLPGSSTSFLREMVYIATYLPVLFAIFFSGDAIASEIDKRTGYYLFSNPVRRESVVVGKFSACFIATAIIVLLAYGLLTGLAAFTYGAVPVEVLWSLALALAGGAGVVGFSFLFSSVSKGVVGSTVAPFLFVFFGFNVIQQVLIVAGYKPWYILNFAGSSVSSVFPGSFGVMGFTPDPTTSLFVLLGYCFLPLGISVLVTRRKQIA